MSDIPIPPQNIDAEQSVLGALLLDKNALYRVADLLSPDKFYSTKHGLIYQAVLDMADSGTPVDMVTMTEHLREKKLLDDVGGIGYITLLSRLTPTAANARHYAEIVNRKWLYRKIKEQASTIANRAQSEGDVDEIMEQVTAMLSLSIATKGIESLGEKLDRNRSEIQQTADRPQHIYPTGINGLNSFLMGGFIPGYYYVVAGRPSMGKSTVVRFIADEVLHADHGIYYAALDDPEQDLLMQLRALTATRFNCEGPMEYARFIANPLNYASEFQWLDQQIDHYRFFIDDRIPCTVQQMASTMTQLKVNGLIDLAMCDYFTNIQVRIDKNAGRAAAYGNASNAVKMLGKQLEIPIVMIAQLNRMNELRPNKRPMQSDLRDTGQIEQDADVIIFCHHEHQYDSKAPVNILELIVAKNKKGRRGTVLVYVDWATGYIRDVEEMERRNYFEYLNAKKGRKKSG